MGDVSIADLDQLDSICDQAIAIQPTIEQLASGAGITGTSDCRWGRNAATAYVGFDTTAKAATKNLAALLPEQVAVIRQYTKRERELQQKTKRETEKLSEVIPQMPTVKPSAPSTGGPNSDGTWNI